MLTHISNDALDSLIGAFYGAKDGHAHSREQSAIIRRFASLPSHERQALFSLAQDEKLRRVSLRRLFDDNRGRVIPRAA